MTCLFTVEKCQGEAEKKTYVFDWTLKLARLWKPNTPFDADMRVRPAGYTSPIDVTVDLEINTIADAQTGFEYSYSGGVSSGKKEPKWPTTLGGTVVDGSGTWTCEAITEDSLLEQIDTSEWEIETGPTGEDQGMTVLPAKQSTEIKLSGGAVGETYTVTNTITTDIGNEYSAVVSLSIDV